MGRVLRKATRIDIERQKDNNRQAQEAYLLIRKLIAEFKLNMKVAYVEFNFQATKATFFYTSEERVDYRNTAIRYRRKFLQESLKQKLK